MIQNFPTFHFPSDGYNNFSFVQSSRQQGQKQQQQKLTQISLNY